MKRNHLLIGVICLSGLNISLAGQTAIPVAYKWEKNGLTHYTAYKPNDVSEKDVIKLDAQGRVIVDVQDGDFVQLEQTVRPEGTEGSTTEKEETKAGSDASAKEVSKELAAKQLEELRAKNCKVAQKNMQMIDGGEVYEPDEKGNMMKLSKEQLEANRKRVQKDIDYYCGK